MGLLARQWRRLNEKTIGSDAYWTIAVQNSSVFHDTQPLVEEYIQGKTLDIGAGNLAWKPLLSSFTDSYISCDLSIINRQQDLVFDATKSFPLKSASFDSLFCHSVLEHTAMPWAVLHELYGVLKSNGVLLLSVPFIFYLHGAPFDYFRFTKFGVSRLAKEAGFTIEKMKLSGGICHFLINIPSVILSTILAFCRLTACIPPVTKILLKCAQFLDRRFDPQGLFAMNIICVLRKKS